MNVSLKVQSRICYSTNFHLRTWLLYSLSVADSVQGTNGRISEEGKQGVKQIARNNHQANEKAWWFLFLRKQGLTEIKLPIKFGGVGNIA